MLHGKILKDQTYSTILKFYCQFFISFSSLELRSGLISTIINGRRFWNRAQAHDPETKALFSDDGRCRYESLVLSWRIRRELGGERDVGGDDDMLRIQHLLDHQAELQTLEGLRGEVVGEVVAGQLAGRNVPASDSQSSRHPTELVVVEAVLVDDAGEALDGALGAGHVHLREVGHHLQILLD